MGTGLCFVEEVLNLVVQEIEFLNSGYYWLSL
jgi:hypothetical protein